jgi:ectoine hydroxylase-related dioxygenase (phytanoyl-CoA dioxygenase family)
MSAALYPVLQSMLAGDRLSRDQADNAVAACAEGYSFPTNLDRDPPIGGLAPQTQQALMRQALQENWPAADFNRALEAQGWRRLT